MKKEQINEVIRSVVTRSNFLLIEVLFRGSAQSPIVEVYIDGEESVTIEQCAEISKQLHEELDTAGLEPERYRIDVSSPGVERPLIYPQQYKKHLNRNLLLTVSGESGEKRTVEGTLLSIEGDSIVLKVKKETQTVQFATIVQALVTISFK